MEAFSDRVSAYAKVKYRENSGKYFGECPFCRSGIESFGINNDTDTFYCYICGNKGTSEDFFRAFSKEEVVKIRKEDKDAVLKDIYDDAALFFFQRLHRTENPGIEYLREKRRLNRDQITSFGLGYAPNEYSELYKALKAKYSKEDLLRAGLIRENEKGYVRDFFRNRVMFPITGQDGRVIAFGGRALTDDSGPKYLNSAESELFSKRTTLYGYPYSLSEGKELVVCEGYMDLIALQTHGFRDSCAVLGTALTPEHAELIRKKYSRVILCLDSDAAGRSASRRSIKVLEEVGITCRIPDLSPAKDPDEFLKRFPIRNLEVRFMEATPSDSFLARTGDVKELVDILKKRQA